MIIYYIMYPKKTTPLAADKTYKRPDVTYQEQLTKEEIIEKMKGYTRVENIMDVPVNTHLRYFIEKDGKKIFRNGGFLHNKINGDVYVILSNGKNSWSVQVKGTIFYKKMSHTEEINSLKSKYEKKIKEQYETITELKTQIDEDSSEAETIQPTRTNKKDVSVKLVKDKKTTRKKIEK